MAKKSSVIKWIFALLAICILLPVVFVLLLNILNKRRPQIDYLAEYNRISKPANFDPNDNAAPYFEKAFEVMTKEPNDFESFRRLWPADMNEDQLQIAKKWVASNNQAIDYLKQGISKKYYWKLLYSDNNEILKVYSTLPKVRKAVYLLVLDAKLMAQEGQIEAAFRQLTDAYKMGTFLGGSGLLIDQLVGIGISSFAVYSAFQVLDHTNPTPTILKDFQQRISDLSFDKPFLLKFDGERLIFKDEVERRFSGRGGVLPFSKDSASCWKILLMSTLGRPWATREIRKADVIYDYLNSAAHKTPWQLHSEGNDIDKVTSKMTKGTLYLRILIPACSRILPMSYRAQVCTDALIATTAILRYKADKGRYPNDLQELVASGYLDKLPMDPFGGGPLVYKLSGDNFELYSFAQDFDDDGGKHDPKWADEGDGDYVFWPVQRTELDDKTKKRNKDITVRQTVDVNSQ